MHACPSLFAGAEQGRRSSTGRRTRNWMLLQHPAIGRVGFEPR